MSLYFISVNKYDQLPKELNAKITPLDPVFTPLPASALSERAAAADLAQSLYILGKLGKLEMEDSTTTR